MIDLPQLKTRVARLTDLTRKVGKEVARCKAHGGPLLPQQQRAYLRGIQGPGGPGRGTGHAGGRGEEDGSRAGLRPGAGGQGEKDL